MRRAGHAGVVGAERHLHHVELALVDVAALDDALGGVADGEVDAGVVVRRRDDEVHLGHDAVLVGVVVVDEVAARGLDGPDAPRGLLGRNVAYVLVEDGVVLHVLQPQLGALAPLNNAGPVVRQRRVHRLAAQRLVHLLELGLGERRLHPLGGV